MHPTWITVPKSYFPPDGERPCYVESDPSCQGKPLWPFDPHFDTEAIRRNVATVHGRLQTLGGLAVAGHVPLLPDRSLTWTHGPLREAPERLASCYIAAGLIPKPRITDTQMRFHVRGGKSLSLHDITLPQSGTWLLSNFGFFMTPQLIMDPAAGGLPHAHNVLHPPHEHLSTAHCGHLGGWYEGGHTIFPPLFPSAGVAVASDGHPVLLGTTTLPAQGTCTIGETALPWGGDAIRLTTPWSERAGFPGSLNLAIINYTETDTPKAMLAYVSEGDCLQPASAVVLSLSKAAVQRHFPKLIHATSDEWRNALHDHPIRFDCDPWWTGVPMARQVAQGLMHLGPGPADLSLWSHPNAVRLQETFLTNALTREPRMLVFETDHYFGMLAASGRYEMSIGLGLCEMAPVATRLVAEYVPQEKLKSIIGLDGGSSVKLCMIDDGQLLPLHWAAPGIRNQFGDPFGNTGSTLSVRLHE